MKTPLIEALEKWAPYTAKVRGETLDDKFQQLLMRYQKVVNDSKNDLSDYRVEFSSAHSWASKQLGLIDNSLSVDIEKQLAKVAFEAWALIRVDVMKNEPTTHGMFSGRVDALSLIALEILSILE